MPQDKTLSMLPPFKRIAVLGAGTMGSQIAAHLANAGASVDLLDIASDRGGANAVVEKAFSRLRTMKPDPFFTADIASRIRLGNFREHLDRLSEAEWVIEAVVERLDIKRDVMARIEEHASEHAVISTNTSGIPIREIAEGRTQAFKRRFLGTHFFNPPRYLKLLELIPIAETEEAVTERVRTFARIHLGKGVVQAKDVPYFIGNRIGIYAMLLAIAERENNGFSIEEVDALTGQLVGHPKSATFRTADVVGLDVMKAVISNLHDAVPDDEHRDIFRVPEELETLVSSGRLGAKSGAGYYRKEGKTIRSFDPATGEYTDPAPVDLPALDTIGSMRGLDDRLTALFEDESRAGAFFRRTTLGLLSYAAARIPEVTDSPADVDRAIRWGFGWQMGPFEMWDVLGTDRVAEAMKKEGLPVPDWLPESYYVDGNVFEPTSRSHVAIRVSTDEQSVFSVPDAGDRILWKNEETVLYEGGHQVAFLEFTSKANTMGAQVIAGIQEAISVVENEPGLRGLVIANNGTNFSVGANLGEVGMALQSGALKQIESAVAAFQQAMERVRYAGKPVVPAVHQRVLGGATELVLSSPHLVAAAESYIGLVELGVGLIPAGTGCLRLATRAAERAPNGHPSEILAALSGFFRHVAMADVATSAAQAVEYGYLSSAAPVVMRDERRFHVAAQEVVRLSEQGYMPPARPRSVRVLGTQGKAALDAMVYQFHQGGYISDYDRELASRLAHVMTGGDLPGDALVPPDHILDLEREAFMHLLAQKKTQERIRHLLETGKPLRN